jgi:hypothetical protein
VYPQIPTIVRNNYSKFGGNQMNATFKKSKSEFSKDLVWNTMHQLIQKIEDGKIDSDKINGLMWALKISMGKDIGGLQPIPLPTWEAMDKWNEALDKGFDEMIEEGLFLFERLYEYELNEAEASEEE